MLRALGIVFLEIWFALVLTGTVAGVVACAGFGLGVVVPEQGASGCGLTGGDSRRACSPVGVARDERLSAR